jgi:phosphohistidine phosphatase
MKYLFIIRHAQAGPDTAAQTDFERPLSDRGRGDATGMAKLLLHNGLRPDLIVSSPALRAWATTACFSAMLHLPGDRIQTNAAVYEAGTGTLLDIVNRFDNRYDRVALVGHNPGLSNLAELLSGRELGNLPTCSVVYLGFETPAWEMISSGMGTILLFDYPRNAG